MSLVGHGRFSLPPLFLLLVRFEGREKARSAGSKSERKDRGKFFFY